MSTSISPVGGTTSCASNAAAASAAPPRTRATPAPPKQDTVHISEAAKAALGDKDGDGDSR